MSTEQSTQTAPSVTAEHASFTIGRRYSSSPQRVFAAFSDAAKKRAWFAEGSGFQVGEYSLDFRVGGRESSSFRVKTPEFESPEISNDTYYFDIEQNRRVVFGYSMSNVGVPFSVSLTTITLTPDGTGTKLRHVETVQFLGGADGLAMREGGTRSLYERLAEELGEEFDAEKMAWSG